MFVEKIVHPSETRKEAFFFFFKYKNPVIV